MAHRGRFQKRVVQPQVAPRVIQIPYTSHEGQHLVHMDTHRFKVLANGRRWGKSYFGVMELYSILMKSESKFPRGWIVAPTYLLAREDWRIALELFGEAVVDRNVNEMRLMVICNPPGQPVRVGEIEFKSAERSDEGLRGAGLDGVLMDECSRIPRDAWELGIRPALADKRGKGIFISTPAGRNWFYEIWKLGEEGLDSEWKSWRFPSNTNKYFPPEEWAKLEKSTPDLVWRQEYLAEFLEDTSTVFRGLQKCEGGHLRAPEEGDRFSLGVDLARTHDFTVILAMTDSGQLTYVHRSKELDWSIQKKMIQGMWVRHNRGLLNMDSSGVGDPVEEDLRKSGVAIQSIKTGSTLVKTELIENLMVVIEQGWLSIPNERQEPSLRWLWEELRSFTVKVLPETGHMRYTAPDGHHDDGVIALALAAWGIRHKLGRKPPTKEFHSPYTTYKEYDRMTDPLKKKRTWIGGIRIAPTFAPLR